LRSKFACFLLGQLRIGFLEIPHAAERRNSQVLARLITGGKATVAGREPAVHDNGTQLHYSLLLPLRRRRRRQSPPKPAAGFSGCVVGLPIISRPDNGRRVPTNTSVAQDALPSL